MNPRPPPQLEQPASTASAPSVLDPGLGPNVLPPPEPPASSAQEDPITSLGDDPLMASNANEPPVCTQPSPAPRAQGVIHLSSDGEDEVCPVSTTKTYILSH